MRNNKGKFILLAVVLFVLVGGGLAAYEWITVDWISFMEIQPSFRPMEDPLPVPKDSVPIQGPAYIPGSIPDNPVPADEVSLQRGKVLYDIHCALCHGESGKGDGPIASYLTKFPPADLTTEEVSAQADGALFLIITNGIPGAMPALRENLTVRERWDVVNYLRQLEGSQP